MKCSAQANPESERLVVASDWKEWGMGVTVNGHGVSYGVMIISKIRQWLTVAQLCEYTVDL